MSVCVSPCRPFLELYADEMAMFGYSVNDYFDAIGVPGLKISQEEEERLLA